MTAPASSTPGATGPRPDPAEGGLKRVMGPGLLLLFIVGDILGTGVYALTGQVAAEVGGAAWLPFVCAFAVAMLTACSYLELVTKFPQAAGAALYTHKAFGVHFLTFVVAFTVMASGITSASTAARAFAANFAEGFSLSLGEGLGVTAVALVFILVIAAVNFRGVGESVKANVVLTLVELTGLLFVIAVGAVAIGSGEGDLSRAADFDTGSGGVFGSVTTATALAFFAMVGFEDSVNMAEETKDPSRVFPRIMLLGLSVTGLIYVLVSISAVALVPVERLGEGDTPLLQVVEAGAPGFPLGIFAFVTMFAVANSALINMLMASRLMYGMSRQAVIPAVFGRVHAGRRSPWVAILVTTGLAVLLITVVQRVPALGGTTSLLLLCVFAVVNVACLVLRQEPVEHRHFRAPTALPVLGAVLCVFLASPLVDRDPEQYRTAGVLLALGVLLWVVAALFNKRRYGTATLARDPALLKRGPGEDGGPRRPAD